VLVVDDDEGIVFAIREILQFDGYDVLIARNGREALQVLEEHQPAVVLLDMRMPVLDGWGFAEELRRRGRDVPLVVMTAAKDAAQWATEIDARAYIPKPFEMDDLLDTVGRIA
jgi:CheY-like chemotaxis protein